MTIDIKYPEMHHIPLVASYFVSLSSLRLVFAPLAARSFSTKSLWTLFPGWRFGDLDVWYKIAPHVHLVRILDHLVDQTAKECAVLFVEDRPARAPFPMSFLLPLVNGLQTRWHFLELSSTWLDTVSQNGIYHCMSTCVYMMKYKQLRMLYLEYMHNWTNPCFSWFIGGRG